MILVIDNYDSFTYNLVDYFGRITDAEILVYRNDKISINQIKELNPDYIVISPGPKTPKEAGISKDVIKSFGAHIPILGVCLGHQAIGEVFGSTIYNAKELMHGKTSPISHNGHFLFNNISSPFDATRYHSLAIKPDTLAKDLEALAFTADGEIMAIAHKTLPIYGVQFHPESICSPDGLQLLENFLVHTNKIS
tara:strand:- start:7498 stop:8079 length:582 start_codon:yes stop_codon:yes gene_type:complete